MAVKTHTCNEKHSWAIDNQFRKFFQSPNKIVNMFISEGMSILDLGCGPGYFTIPLAQKTGNKGSVTAVDIQAGMLTRIKRRIENTPLVNRIILHQSSEKGIGLTGQYDFAFSFWMVHELPDRDKFVKETFKLLKNEGKFLIAEPKGHVSKSFFKETIEITKQSGFTIIDFPKITFSRAVLLLKNTNEQ